MLHLGLQMMMTSCQVQTGTRCKVRCANAGLLALTLSTHTADSSCMNALECVVHVMGMVLQKEPHAHLLEDPVQHVEAAKGKHKHVLVRAGTIQLN